MKKSKCAFFINDSFYFSSFLYLMMSVYILCLILVFFVIVRLFSLVFSIFLVFPVINFQACKPCIMNILSLLHFSVIECFLILMFNCFFGSSVVLSQRWKLISSPDMGAEVSLLHATVHNPLADRSNVGSHSAARHNSSDLDRDAILIDKENVVIPDSVSPSPFRYRSRLLPSKV